MGGVGGVGGMGGMGRISNAGCTVQGRVYDAVQGSVHCRQQALGALWALGALQVLDTLQVQSSESTISPICLKVSAVAGVQLSEVADRLAKTVNLSFSKFVCCNALC